MKRLFLTLKPFAFWFSVSGCVFSAHASAGWSVVALLYLLLWKWEDHDHAKTKRKLESGWIGGPPTGGIVKAIGKNGSLWVKI